MGDSPAAARLRLALDIYAFGEQMERTRLRRLDPGATDAEIDAAISANEATNAGAEAVPIFWLATTDHDLDEISHVSILGADGSLQKLSATTRGRPDAPVGDALAARRTGLDEPAGGRASARG